MDDLNYFAKEPGIPRTVKKSKHRVQRLTGLGNGQVPQCAVLAWEILSKGDLDARRLEEKEPSGPDT